MAMDLWEQLAQQDVPAPPPPQEFDQQVHRRLNKLLLLMHLADLLFRGLVFGIAHFAQAVLHLLAVTVTGNLNAVLAQDKRRPPRNSL